MSRSRMLAPALCMATLLLAGCGYMITLTYLGGGPSRHSVVLYNLTFAIIVVSGVEADRRTLGVSQPYEYKAFLFYLWPIALPVYLFQTRRWRGLLLACVVFLLSEVPSVAAAATYLYLVSAGT